MKIQPNRLLQHIACLGFVLWGSQSAWGFVINSHMPINMKCTLKVPSNEIAPMNPATYSIQVPAYAKITFTHKGLSVCNNCTLQCSTGEGVKTHLLHAPSQGWPMDETSFTITQPNPVLKENKL